MPPCPIPSDITAAQTVLWLARVHVSKVPWYPGSTYRNRRFVGGGLVCCERQTAVAHRTFASDVRRQSSQAVTAGYSTPLFDSVFSASFGHCRRQQIDASCRRFASYTTNAPNHQKNVSLGGKEAYLRGRRMYSCVSYSWRKNIESTRIPKAPEYDHSSGHSSGYAG